MSQRAYKKNAWSRVLAALFYLAILISVAATFAFTFFTQISGNLIWSLVLGLSAGGIATLTLSRYQGRKLHENIAGKQDITKNTPPAVTEPNTVYHQKILFLSIYTIKDFLNDYFLFSAGWAWILSVHKRISLDFVRFNPLLLLMTIAYWSLMFCFHFGTDISENWDAIDEEYAQKHGDINNPTQIWLPNWAQNASYATLGTSAHSLIEHSFSVIGCIPPELVAMLLASSIAGFALATLGCVLLIALPLFIQTYYFDRKVYLETVAKIQTDKTIDQEDNDTLSKSRWFLQFNRQVLIPWASVLHGFAFVFPVLMLMQVLLPVLPAYIIAGIMLVCIVSGHFSSEGITARQEVQEEIDQLDNVIGSTVGINEQLGSDKSPKADTNNQINQGSFASPIRTRPTDQLGTTSAANSNQQRQIP